MIRLLPFLLTLLAAPASADAQDAVSTVDGELTMARVEGAPKVSAEILTATRKGLSNS